jgi:hypothetical protein
MSNLTNESDLCADADRLQDAIDLFNDTFRFGEDPILSFFFDRTAIEQLMIDRKCLGIKVFPAIEDKKDNDKISITMVLKAHFDEIPTGGEGAGLFIPPPICCPTPGVPLLTERTKRITHWAFKIMSILFK